MSLHTKYRPKMFAEIRGNKVTVNNLKSLLSLKDMPRAFLFSGQSGTGKTTLAGVLATELGCTSPAVQFIDAASERGIEAIRQLTRSLHIRYLFGGPYQIYIIDESHQMTPDAMHALLRSLENPGRYAIFIFCTTDPEKMLPTLLKRCYRYKLELLSDKELLELVENVMAIEHIQLPVGVKEVIVQASKGVPREALVYLGMVRHVKSREEAILLIDPANQLLLENKHEKKSKKKDVGSKTTASKCEGSTDGVILDRDSGPDMVVPAPPSQNFQETHDEPVNQKTIHLLVDNTAGEKDVVKEAEHPSKVSMSTQLYHSEEVIPIPLYATLKAPPFPIDRIPAGFARYVKEASRLQGVPTDYIVMPQLSMFGTFLGTSLCYKPMTLSEGMTLYPVLWSLIVGDPGENKGVMHHAIKPLYDEDKRLNDIYEKEYAEYQIACEEWKHGDGDLEKPEKPKHGRMIVSSVTIEKLVEILKDNPRGIALVVDELGQFINGMSQYNRKSEARQIWLSLWTNEKIIIDRVSRGHLRVERPFVNIISATQPSMLSKQLLKEKDGMAQRFQLMAYPEKYEGAMVNEVMDNSVKDILPKLSYAMHHGRFGMPWKDGTITTQCLTSTDDACNAFMSFSDRMKKLSREQIDLGLQCQLAKYSNFCARLATVLHCLRTIEENDFQVTESSEPVSLSTMENAIFLCEEYFWPHAERIYSLCDQNTKKGTTQMLGRRLIVNPDLKKFTERDLLRRNWKGLNESEVLQDALEYLVKYGWLFPESPKKMGRKTTYYVVNSKIQQFDPKTLLAIAK